MICEDCGAMLPTDIGAGLRHEEWHEWLKGRLELLEERLDGLSTNL